MARRDDAKRVDAKGRAFAWTGKHRAQRDVVGALGQRLGNAGFVVARRANAKPARWKVRRAQTALWQMHAVGVKGQRQVQALDEPTDWEGCKLTRRFGKRAPAGLGPTQQEGDVLCNIARKRARELKGGAKVAKRRRDPKKARRLQWFEPMTPSRGLDAVA